MSDERIHPEWSDDPLDPRLADAFAALPRELPLVPGQEDRTVAALRATGWLAPTGVAAERGWMAEPAGVLPLIRRPDARAWRTMARVAVALAASLAIFVGGALWGEARASRRTLEALLQRNALDTRTAAALVQRAGSAYVTSVADFASRESARDPATLAQGREAAHAVLRAAAEELARLDPRDPLARQILNAPRQQGQPPRGVVWF